MLKLDFQGADGERLTADLLLPATASADRLPAVLLFPAIAGINDYVHRVAERLTAHGFAVSVIDYFVREGSAPDVSTPAAIGSAVAALPDLSVTGDAVGLLSALRAHPSVRPDNVGTLGFCIGGMYALMLSAEVYAGVSACVDYYGTVRYSETSESKPVSPIDKVADLKAPVLAHFGTFDRLISGADIDHFEQTLQAHGKAYELYRYRGAPHAFDEDFRPTVFRPVAAKAAWQRTITFFNWYLKAQMGR